MRGRKQTCSTKSSREAAEEINPKVFLVFWGALVAGGILVPQPGIEPMPPALEAWSLNHWMVR